MEVQKNREFLEARKKLIQVGQNFYSKGWVPATSGNFSVRLDGGFLAITASGKHKGKLGPDDILFTDSKGAPVLGENPQEQARPSAETQLHVQIYEMFPQAKCVLHPHSANATVLSRIHKNKESITLSDYELLKAFPGIDTHECSVQVPLFKNDQDIPRLAEKIKKTLAGIKPVFGYLIEGHGFYTWAESVEHCAKQVEAFEFLFHCEILLQ